MIRLVISLIVVAALGSAAAFIADRPGRIALDWQGQRIETSMAVALLALAAIVALALGLYIVLRRLLAAPRSVRTSLAIRRRDQAHAAFTRGMVAIAAGDPRNAAAAAGQVERLLPQSSLGLLLGAQSAQLAGDREGARRRYTAMVGRKDTELLGLRGLMSLAVQDGNEAEAKRLATRAVDLKPDVAWALLILIEAEARARNWTAALAMTERALKHQALPPSEAHRKKAAILVEQAREAQTAGDLPLARKRAQAALSLVEGHPAAAVMLADVLQSLGKQRRARGVLQSAWSAAPHPDIAAAWARLHENDPKPRRITAMAELVGRVWSDDPAARLAMARAAMEGDDLTRARAELDQIAEPGPAALQLRADLDRRQYGDQHAGRDLAALAATAPPDPAWLCEACGDHGPAWHALCPACNAFDTLRWKRPDRRALLAPRNRLAIAAL
jgi:HemY protein